MSVHLQVLAIAEKLEVNRLHFFDPDLTRKQIAELTGLHPHQVRDAIHAVEIPAECYENLPEIK